MDRAEIINPAAIDSKYNSDGKCLLLLSNLPAPGIGQFLDMRLVEGGQVVGFRLSRAFDC